MAILCIVVNIKKKKIYLFNFKFIKNNDNRFSWLKSLFNTRVGFFMVLRRDVARAGQDLEGKE